MAVQAQTVRLTRVQARRRRATAAVLAERDAIAQLKAAIVAQEIRAQGVRNTTSTNLSVLHTRLLHEAAVLDAQAARARTLSSGGAVAPPAGCTNGPFVPHGGEFGFFQAPGTDYSVNQEPIIAARLDQLGQALQLHLVGISGYRSPGTRSPSAASPTIPTRAARPRIRRAWRACRSPTLNQFCLTRPFGGAAEADHIQLTSATTSVRLAATWALCDQRKTTNVPVT